MRAWYPNPASVEMLSALRGLIGSVEIETEPSDGVEILVDGRPTNADLDRCPHLKALIVPFAGVPQATRELMLRHPNIAVHNLHHNAPDTAEMALTLMLAAAKLIVPADRDLRQGSWALRYAPEKTIGLLGKHALILGFGEIGQRIAQGCLSLGMRVSAIRRNAQTKAHDSLVEVFPTDSLHDLLPSTQVLLIALPQTLETEGLIGVAELALLPKNAVLVNVARAQIVDEKALYDALKERSLHSAGLDVWYRYPDTSGPTGGVPGYFQMPDSAESCLPSKLPFHELDNVVMSPHRGGASRESERRRIEALAELLIAAATGDPMPNRVDLTAGY